MRIAFFTVGTCVVLIAVMVAVAYVCNRLNIGTGGQYLKNYPSSALPPCKRLSTTHSRTASP